MNRAHQIADLYIRLKITGINKILHKTSVCHDNIFYFYSERKIVKIVMVDNSTNHFSVVFQTLQHKQKQ